MKGSNSRQNFDAKSRFTNLYHVQGGMITDADLNERAQIDQARDETIARSAISHGVPDVGGMITYDGDTPHLRAGLVFADGKAGRFALSNPAGDKPDLGFVLANQADFPNAPALDEGPHLIYADVWDRTVFAGQNAALTDPGLHGTETSYRTKTMVQLKSVPVEDDDIAALLDQMTKRPQFATKGAATLSIETKQSDIQVSGCDPCADQITVDDTLPNMLWRLEIVDVQREAGSDQPKTVRLAWSSENASVMDRNTEGARAGLVRDEAVYQFLSDRTEAHQGWFPAQFRHQRSAFTDNIENTPGADEDTVYTHVRRWDGMAEADIQSGEITDFIGRTEPRFAGSQLTIQTDFFSAAVTFDRHDAMIGDYWLVEVRRFARDADQIRLIGADDAGEAYPIGITHHFCPLAFADEGKAVAPPQALRQITQMPTLSTLQAADSGYSPPANCPVFGGAGNVQEALDALCGLEAKNVAIAPSDCDTLAEVDNVQDALEALCAADNERSLRVMLRTMMDWGVVCGLRLTADFNDPGVIHYTGGTALNREGLLREVPASSIHLNKLDEAQIHGRLAEIQKLHGEVCLSLELREDREPLFHLSSPTYPYVDSDKALKERIADCLKSKDRIDDSDILRELDEKQMLVLNKVMTSWTNRKAFGLVVDVAEDELEIGLEIFNKLSEEFQKRSDEATNARLNTLLKDADEDFQKGIEGSGSNASNERLRHLVANFGILATVEAGSQSGCTCDAALPDCAVHGSAKPVLIPIGCVRFAQFEPGKLVITEVCDLCCRKLAHTWQNYRYYYGDQMGPQFREYEDTCCSYFDDASGLETFLDRWTPTEEDLDPKSGSPFWPPDPGITNQKGRNGPDVRGVTLGMAQELLEKSGVKLNEEFIFEREEQLFERLVEALKKPINRPLGLVFEARKDDVVGLITEKGVVVDLFVIEASPYYGYNTGKSYSVTLEDDSSGASGPIDVSGVDLSKNPGFKDLFDTVGNLVDGQGNGSVSVDGGSIPIDTNPAITGLRDQIAALEADIGASTQPTDPRPPYVLTDDTAFIDVNDRLEGLRNRVDSFTVTGDSLDLSNNPTIQDIQRTLADVGSGTDVVMPDFTDEFANIWAAIDGVAATEIDLSNDPVIAGIQETLTGLENGAGINASTLDLGSNADFQALQGQINQPPAPVDGAALDIAGNNSITGMAADIGALSENVGSLQTQINALPAAIDLASDPIIAGIQETLTGLQNGDGIDARTLDLSDNTDFLALQGLIGTSTGEPPAPVDGATLDISGNPSITGIDDSIGGLSANLGSLQEQVNALPDPVDLARDPIITTMQTHISRLQNSNDIDVLRTAHDRLRADVDTLSTTVENLPEPVEIPDIPDISQLESDVASLSNLPGDLSALGTRVGALEDADHLTLNEVLTNQTISRLRTDITALQRTNTTQSNEITALRDEVTTCKQMILGLTPLRDVIKNDNLSKLEEAGISTVGAAVTAGQDGLSQIMSKTAAAAIMKELNEFLGIRE